MAKQLEKEMIEAVRKLEFEKAALLRDQIAFLRGEGSEKRLQSKSVGGYNKKNMARIGNITLRNSLFVTPTLIFLFLGFNQLFSGSDKNGNFCFSSIKLK